MKITLTTLGSKCSAPKVMLDDILFKITAMRWLNQSERISFSQSEKDPLGINLFENQFSKILDRLEFIEHGPYKADCS